MSNDRMNPTWHNVFQLDKDEECGPDGWIDYILLSYGSKKYIMPTVLPRDLNDFTQFEGIVMYMK